MSPRSLPLMNRLRRHRGLWLLVVAVMLIKLVSGSLCLADGGERDVGRAASSPVAGMVMLAAPADAVGGEDCLLGEGASCHCACAHSATLPASMALSIGHPGLHFPVPSTDAGRIPAVPGSLLRPPIA